MKRILIVEDNQITARGLTFLLEKAGYLTAEASDVQSAAHKLQETTFDLAILDIGLKSSDGFELAKNLHNEFPNLPFIFLTARDGEADVVRGLELGASDFITKPFHSRELLLRVRNALFSSPVVSEQKIGNLTYDLDHTKFLINGQEIALTALERCILKRFLETPGQIVTRENLLDEIYDASGKIVNDNTVSVYLKRLREKLAGAIKITTIKNLGYRLGGDQNA